MGQSVAVVHAFEERLAYSQMESDESFWMAVYQKAFPSLVGSIANTKDNEAQRKGIDRVLLLGNGTILKIDEKKRPRDYPDILLEYISNDRTGAVGWIEKDLAIDLLAYAFMPSKKVYFLDWQALRRAWHNHREDWLSNCKRIPAENAGYTTWSVAIPIKTLFIAMYSASIIDLGQVGL